MKQYANRYSCGHYSCGCHGYRVFAIPKHWQVKEILAPCRECKPKVKRLNPELVQRIAEEEW